MALLHSCPWKYSSVSGKVVGNLKRALRSLGRPGALRDRLGRKQHTGELRVHELEQKAMRLRRPKFVPRGHDLADEAPKNELFLGNQKRLFCSPFASECLCAMEQLKLQKCS
jgi:hypothetical protein